MVKDTPLHCYIEYTVIFTYVLCTYVHIILFVLLFTLKRCIYSVRYICVPCRGMNRRTCKFFNVVVHVMLTLEHAVLKVVLDVSFLL